MKINELITSNQQSAMVNHRLLLSLIAFGVSFSLSLLVKRDISTALLTGLITVPASFAGVFVVNGKQRLEQKPTLNALQAQIYQLQRWETKLNQSVLAITGEKQRIEVNINFLNTQLNQLYAEVTEQRNYKQQLSQDVINLTQDSQQLQTKLHDLQTQIDNSEQRRAELYQSVRSLRTEKHNAEVIYNSIKTDINQLQEQINEQKQQKQELEQDLVVRNVVKIKLEDNLSNLQNQIQELQTQATQLNLSLAAIAQEKQTTEANLNLLKAQIQALEQLNQTPLEPQLIINASNQQLKLEKPDKWTNFGTKLSQPELQVLKVIIQQNEPNAAIKKIAEENITMPELLIDSINECALDTIGDLIIEPGSELVPLGILEEYLLPIQKLINLNESDE